MNINGIAYVIERLRWGATNKPSADLERALIKKSLRALHNDLSFYGRQPAVTFGRKTHKQHMRTVINLVRTSASGKDLIEKLQSFQP